MRFLGSFRSCADCWCHDSVCSGGLQPARANGVVTPTIGTLPPLLPNDGENGTFPRFTAVISNLQKRTTTESTVYSHVYSMLMDLVFDIASSAEFWRKTYPCDRTPTTPTTLMPTKPAYRKLDVMEQLPKWVDNDSLETTQGVFHALAFENRYRRESASVITHVWSDPIPRGSFYKASGDAYIESPQFMFLHAATVLDLETLIAFGNELCGLYAFDNREDRGFRKRTAPLTTKRQLLNFLLLAKGCKGQSKAMRALKYVVEMSASPMETFDEMTTALPCLLGGYALLTPTMNQEIKLSPKAARIANRKKCFLDMGYLPLLLDVEHHGKLDHMTEEEIASDRARVNALREMDIEVVELTIEQVSDLIAYEYIIERIARIQGKRIRKSNLGATPARLHLRESIFKWNASSGAIR